MSKNAHGIDPGCYLELGLEAEWLYYYLAAKLNDRVEDLDFNPEDFVARVNSDLVGKYINIASRAAGFGSPSVSMVAWPRREGDLGERPATSWRTAASSAVVLRGRDGDDNPSSWMGRQRWPM